MASVASEAGACGCLGLVPFAEQALSVHLSPRPGSDFQQHWAVDWQTGGGAD